MIAVEIEGFRLANDAVNCLRAEMAAILDYDSLQKPKG
jgi:hypothetical protein